MKTDPAQKAAQQAAVTRCIDAFYAAYVRAFNPPDLAERWLAAPRGKREQATGIKKEQMVLVMIHGGKDGSHFKQMIAAYGEETVLRLIGLFFGEARTDFRVARSNHDVGALFACAQYLLTRGQRPANPRTLDNLDAAARATRPVETR